MGLCDLAAIETSSGSAVKVVGEEGLGAVLWGDSGDFVIIKASSVVDGADGSGSFWGAADGDKAVSSCVYCE